MAGSKSLLSFALALSLAVMARSQDGAAPVPAVVNEAKSEGEGGKQDPAPDEPKTDLRFTLPSKETIASPEKPKPAAEVEAMWNAMLGKLGYETFAKATTIGFMRGSTHWRNGKQLSYDSWFTRAFVAPPMRARAEFTSNYDENDRLIPFAVIVNDDDRFEMEKRTVLATEANEKNATAQISHELLMGLAPFVLARAGVTPTHVGRSTLASHRPAKLDPDLGCVEFEPVTRQFEVLEVAVPEPYSSVFGPTARFYVDDSGALKIVSANNRRRPEFYPERMRLLYEIVDQTEVGGLLVPTRIDVTLDFDSYPFETIELWDWQIDPELPPKLLRRP